MHQSTVRSNEAPVHAPTLRESPIAQAIHLVAGGQPAGLSAPTVDAAGNYLGSNEREALVSGYGNSALKRAVDFAGVLCISLVLSPIIVVVVAWMMVQGGPILFRHRRIGRHGDTFECLKFRTMVPHADRILQQLLDTDTQAQNEWLTTRKLRDDPRVTKIGKFLRRTSLDELPQLLNVLRGDMSLVGPRPVVPTELGKYGRNATVYLATRPGLTGLWQVNGRNDTSYRRRVALDVYYVRNQSLAIDFLILLRTIGVVLRGGGAY
jgi:lipopolysaccharide/colanic/teichoic acid biosynthesis glycosyltransferase